MGGVGDEDFTVLRDEGQQVAGEPQVVVGVKRTVDGEDRHLVMVPFVDVGDSARERRTLRLMGVDECPLHRVRAREAS